MGITKKININIETKTIGKISKALGHPTRVQIMTLLWKRNNRSCGDIVNLIPLSQSTVSKHLLELKKANLVKVKNEGKKTIYSIEVDTIQILRKYLTSYLLTIEVAEQNKLTVLTTQHKVRTGKSHLKQYNYLFPDKKIKSDKIL
ncbi:DNA-binding transcriptional ArsR family regulator [Flavobacterium sp. 9]|uniref:ArsR/SmtB family transcription factor n=1 Tax=Flavobacterium sp. 9 TaxID=2035198 RepID=UPI000C17C2F1|nr:metalloregulator ArsR/SmtB family transcription factor [Flavobacterium sp. 9]PIF30151.1 DNA-binding transcriptional ArsR family regulator [Flavobacterium sp. 9]